MGRLDRYGEAIDLNDSQPELHDPRCRDGWLGEDAHDRPIPCLACRPHLDPQRATDRRTR